MKREVDAYFDGAEIVLRSIGRRDLRNAPDMKGKTLKGTSLKLQVSVQRVKHGGSVDACVTRGGERDGVASITVGEVWSVPPLDGLMATCVDEPLKDDASHALVALAAICDPSPGADRAVQQAKLRDLVAARFTIALSPTR